MTLKTTTWALLLSLLVAAAAVGGILVLGQSQGSDAAVAAYRERGEASDRNELSVLWKVPAFSFPSQAGRPTTPADLKGRVWIADFIFTECTSVCPLITAKMVLLQRRLADPQLRFVSFSVDPEHDTPQALTQYKESWRPDEARWTLLSTDPKGLRALTDGMHVALEKGNDPANPIVHTSLFFLVDATGAVRGVYDSNDDAALDRLARDVGRLSQSPAAKAASDGKPTAGAELYAALGCPACHERTDLAPSLHGLLGRSVTIEGGATLIADARYIEQSILEPGAQVVSGYLQLMPGYRGQLSKAELERLVSYVSSLPAPSAAPSTARSPLVDASHPTQTMASAASPSAAPSALAGSAPSSPPPASLGVDPVCGMKVRVTPDTPHATHAGHTYYFCSDSCRGRFLKTPEQYASAH